MDRSLEFDYFYGAESEQFSFIKLPKLLFKDRHFKDLSLDAKVVYGLLLDRMSLSTKNGWIDDDNKVYIVYTVSSIADDIDCSTDKAGKILSELDSQKGIGLIERKRRGLGRPDLIYVKNFVKFTDDNADKTGEADTDDEYDTYNTESAIFPVPETEKSGFNTSTYKEKTSKVPYTDDQKTYETADYDFKNPQNEDSGDRDLRIQETADYGLSNPQNTISGDRDLRLQETAKNGSNNTDINNTEYNNTDLIESIPIKSSGKPIKLVDNRHTGVRDEREETLRQIRNNICYDWHIETELPGEREQYTEMYEVIKDLILGEREKIRIGDAVYPYEHVRDRLLCLTGEHLDYVRKNVAENRQRIGSMNAYLKAALFNAPTTLENHYRHLYTYYELGEGRQDGAAG